jgi:hypothetical protein
MKRMWSRWEGDMSIKNPEGINIGRENVLEQVKQAEEVLERIKSDLTWEVQEDDAGVNHASMDRWLDCSTKLTKAIGEHDVAIAYGM